MFSHTPMLRQYKEIKDQHMDCILFFRMGDFYEMFGPDAEFASRELEIVLTARDAGAGNKIPMCGVPHHSAENYIAALIGKGYKVAICEQTEDAAEAKGIVRREVVRIITPGTLIEGKLLQEGQNNFLLCLQKNKRGELGLAAVDISTGEFFTTQVDTERTLFDEITKYNPSEIITSTKNFPYFQALIRKKNQEVVLHEHFDYAFSQPYAEETILSSFGIQSLTSLGISEFSAAIVASGAALDYLKYNQKSALGNLFHLTYYQPGHTMILDYPTRKNLELFSSNNSNKSSTCLLDVLDFTCTAMGARKLKAWLGQPLTQAEAILHRLERTRAFLTENHMMENLQSLLKEVYDLERITARITFETANARDLIALKKSLAILPGLKDLLSGSHNPVLQEIASRLNTLERLHQKIEEVLQEDPPFTLREGGLIKDGFDQEIDSLRDITRNGRHWIARLEQEEREKTGIKNLKIGYNKVFGYYLEITRSNMGQAPDYYIRKQTLANAERYITPELKEMEARVIGADDTLKKREYQLFTQLRYQIKSESARDIMETAERLSEIDVYISFAQGALRYNYTCPRISTDQRLHLEALRHPVVEQNLEGEWYTPNDALMDQEKNNFLLITGPNMGGKSTYCRSIAIAAIMTQIGSFVPARYASMPIFDRVFARIGANDDLTTGQSTFMVEMNEVANIVHNATENSLIILDEVGRGTSTYDGLSLAWALSEYIAMQIRAKTLFATHYHELTALEQKHGGITNLQVTVEENDQSIVFLHKIVPGKADRSYGIQVAALAGLPKIIIRQAKKILSDLESEAGQYRQLSLEHLLEETPFTEEILLEDCRAESQHMKQIMEEIGNLDINQMTPLEAITTLARLKETIKRERA